MIHLSIKHMAVTNFDKKKENKQEIQKYFGLPVQNKYPVNGDDYKADKTKRTRSS